LSERAGVTYEAPGATADVEARAPLSRKAVIWGNLDIVLVVAAVVPAMALDAPEPGFALGAGGWVLSRLVAVFDREFIRRKATDPVKQAAANLFEAFGRIWLLAGVIVAASLLGERQDGLTAAVVIMAAYSVAFIIRLISGPPARRKAAE